MNSSSIFLLRSVPAYTIIRLKKDLEIGIEK